MSAFLGQPTITHTTNNMIAAAPPPFFFIRLTFWIDISANRPCRRPLTPVTIHHRRGPLWSNNPITVPYADAAWSNNIRGMAKDGDVLGSQKW